MKPILVFVSLLLLSVNGYSQEEETVHYAKKYLDINIKSLNKYAKRVERQQHSLLRRLERKERKLERQLKRNDSAAYIAYTSQSLSYDSIRKLLSPDSNTLVSRVGRRVNKVTDSLKAVHSFLQAKTAALGVSNAGAQYQNQIDDVQSRLNYQQYINGLIDQRSNSLKNLAGNATSKLSAFTGIEKAVFYGKSKMNVFKEMADEPSKVEEAALEYLQGVEGFDNAFNSDSKSSTMAKAGSIEELEKMGYQTKRLVSSMIEKQAGGNVEGLQSKLGKQVAEYQSLLSGPASELQNARSKISTARSELNNAQGAVISSSKELKDNGEWKRESLRGLPFRKRIDVGYTWQASRASQVGDRPAILEVGGIAGYRQTPRLTYGVGLGLSTGLGRNWNNIKLSFEGLSLRGYLSYDVIYGFGAFAGYERWVGDDSPTLAENKLERVGRRRTDDFQLGITKAYKVNSKWKGSIQVLYDIWWKDRGLNSPFIIRFTTTKK